MPGRRAGPLVFVGDLDAPELSSDDRHHLERVLRLRRGTEITVCDGAGRWRTCVFGARLEPSGPLRIDAEPTPRLAVGFALVKGQRPEWIVQKLTEIGIDEILPFVAARSVVRWDARRAASNLTRLRKVAREAAMQCGRTRLPTLEPMAGLADLVRPGAALAEPGGPPPTLATPTILVGPEGGWTDEELAGRTTVGLAGPTLRTETAAMAAGVILGGLRAGLVGAAPPRPDEPPGTE